MDVMCLNFQLLIPHKVLDEIFEVFFLNSLLSKSSKKSNNLRSKYL